MAGRRTQRRRSLQKSPRMESRYLPSMGTPLPVNQSPDSSEPSNAVASETRATAEMTLASDASATSTSQTTQFATTSASAPSGVVSEDQVKLALRRVKDPDLQLNVVDLGLIYGTRVDGTTVSVDMTLTSPGCPSGPEIMTDIEREVKTLPGVEQVNVNLLWTPFWTPDRIEPRVRAYLGL